MQTTQRIKKAVLGLLGALVLALPVSSVWAHGGAKGTDTDVCRIEVAGQWVHFTAYTPALTGDAEFCASIPGLGSTNLVFDYEGSKLRKMTVEYEITKEPEGNTVFHSDPEIYPSGTINKVVDFSQSGAGEYLAHVTLVPEKGEKVDAHIGFKVGMGASTSLGQYLLWLLGIVGVLYILYQSSSAFKEQADAVLGKLKSF